MNRRFDSEVAMMESMSIGELRSKYIEVFNEATGSRNKPWLVKRIAWRIQANAEGGLSERARRRATELADDAELRLTAPRPSKRAAATAPAEETTTDVILSRDQILPGTVIKRTYKGRLLRVEVISGGFQYEGERYKSLTALAKKITGKHWNGFNFFKISQGAEA